MHSPFTKVGRLRIKKTFLASGPATARFPEPREPKEPQNHQGWRFGSNVARYAVGTCLAANVLFLIFASALTHVTNGIGVLHEGDCEKIRTLDTWAHVIINGLATAIVGASNYTMQCLAAPNRSEIDAAHAKGVWLDIGVPSVRNLRHIAWRRVALWFALVVSTIPVHLMWNSVIFSTIQDNTFVVVGASADILQDDQFDCTAASFNLTVLDISYGQDYSDVVCDMYNHARIATEAQSPLTMLEAKECIKLYGTEIQSKWSNVVVVFDHADLDDSCTIQPLPSNATQLFAFQAEGQFWKDDERCFNGDNLTRESDVHPNQFFIVDYTEGQNYSGGHYYSDGQYYSESGYRYPQYPIEHCLAMEGSKSCRLEFSLPILLVVIICNIIKLSAIIYTVKVIKEKHFMTLGDAVASFLEAPDKTTFGHCLNTKSFFQRKYPQLGKYSLISLAFRTRDAETGKETQLFWFRAPSVKRWCFILVS